MEKNGMNKIILLIPVLLASVYADGPISADTQANSQILPGAIITQKKENKTKDSNNIPIRSENSIKKNRQITDQDTIPPEKTDLQLTIATAATYSNNVYTYDQEKIAMFHAKDSAHAYYFHRVKSMEDWSYPLAMHLLFKTGYFKANLRISGELFTFNSPLNNVTLDMSAGYNRRLYLGVGYVYTPYSPVRPTAIGYDNESYQIFAFTRNVWLAQCIINSSTISPFFTVSFTRYDFSRYGKPFTIYNSNKYGGEVGINRKGKVFSYDCAFYLSTQIAHPEKNKPMASSANPYPDTTSDFSNIPFGINGGLNIHLDSWNFGLKAGLSDKIYRATASSDSYYNRKDLSGMATPYINYTWKIITVLFQANDTWSVVKSPNKNLGDDKSYNEIGVRLSLLWNFNLI
jgi:hypothetical protein